MCNFFTFLGFKNGDFFHASDCTDSHEDLILACNVHDSEIALLRGNFFRGEFTPPQDLTTVSDLSTWTLRVDENIIPSWYDASKTREWCEAQVSRMIIKDKRKILLGGCWIFDGMGSSVGKLVHGKIKIVSNGANLSGANLRSANLSGANLSGATGYALPGNWEVTDSGIVRLK